MTHLRLSNLTVKWANVAHWFFHPVNFADITTAKFLLIKCYLLLFTDYTHPPMDSPNRSNS